MYNFLCVEFNTSSQFLLGHSMNNINLQYNVSESQMVSILFYLNFSKFVWNGVCTCTIMFKFTSTIQGAMLERIVYVCREKAIILFY